MTQVSWGYFLFSSGFILFSCVVVFASPSVSIGAGATPSVESVFISNSSFGQSDDYSGGTINDLTAGGTTDVYVNGTVEDLDGNEDIESVKLVFRRSGVALGNSCTQDGNDCYRMDACTLQNNGDGNQKDYDCAIALKYWADATDTGGRYPDEDWVAEVTVSDGTLSTLNNTVTKEMGTLLALDIPTVLNLGSFLPGAISDSPTNAEQSIGQHGNDEADLEVSMDDAELVCDQNGVISRESIEWALTDVSHGDAASTPLAATATDTNLHVAYRDSEGANATKTLYWNIAVPFSGIEGVCTSTNTVMTAVSH